MCGVTKYNMGDYAWHGGGDYGRWWLLMYMPYNQLIGYTLYSFVHVKSYLLLKKIFFIFNIHIYFVNESIVKIMSLEQKFFVKKIIK